MSNMKKKTMHMKKTLNKWETKSLTRKHRLKWERKEKRRLSNKLHKLRERIYKKKISLIRKKINPHENFHR